MTLWWQMRISGICRLFFRCVPLKSGSFIKEPLRQGSVYQRKALGKNAMLTLRVKLIYDKKSKLDNRSAISWRRTRPLPLPGLYGTAHPGTASWNTEESARYYFRFSRSETALIPASCVRYKQAKNHYDFSSQMTEPGEYQFRVRTVRQSSHTTRVSG